MNRFEDTPAGDLEDLRVLTLERLTRVPAFRRGSLQQLWRKCGKPNCHCAAEGDPGHGPRWQWTRTARDGTRGQALRADQADAVRAELDAGAQFDQIVDDLVEVNEAICRQAAAPVGARQARPAKKSGT
ncbi:MAG: hypothetical protein LBD97_00120 [Bifidobacteriaceae bacterium]|nr:hypothetical protein [Bifidobacteriaceae bacterium]